MATIAWVNPNFSPVTQISSAFLAALFNYVIHQVELKYRTINVNKELSTMKLILVYYIEETYTRDIYKRFDNSGYLTMIMAIYSHFVLILVTMNIQTADAKFPAVARLYTFHANFSAATALAETTLCTTTGGDLLARLWDRWQGEKPWHYDLPSASIPFLLLGEDQDAVSRPGSRHLPGNGNAWCGILLHRMLEGDSLVLYQYKTTYSCSVACINLRNAIHLTDEFRCRYYRVFSEIFLPKVS